MNNKEKKVKTEKKRIWKKKKKLSTEDKYTKDYRQIAKYCSFFIFE